jgi:group I intron endonuclease
VNCGIYTIASQVDGKVYVGSSKNIKERWWTHRTQLRSGTHHSTHLQNSWNKYGEENFVFDKVLICSQPNLLFYEDIYMKYHKSLDRKFGFNIANVNLEDSQRTLSQEHYDSLKEAFRDKHRNHLYDGKYLSLIEIAEITNTEYNLLRSRVVDGGLSIEEAITKPKQQKHLPEYNGEIVTVEDIAKMLNIHPRRVNYRISEGYSVQDIIDRVKSESKDLSISEFCRLSGFVHTTTVKSRIKSGMSLMDAITKPSRSMDNTWRNKEKSYGTSN